MFTSFETQTLYTLYLGGTVPWCFRNWTGIFVMRLSHVYTVGIKKSCRFVPFFIPFFPFRSVPFRSNRLPRANSFSARHEFVCKIHCVRWRSIARLFSTTRSRDGFFPTMRRATGRALSRSSLLGCVRGLEETGALALTCIFYASLSNILHL